MESHATAQDKYQHLLADLEQMGSVLVAYSGGIDSTLLAFAAQRALGRNSLAVLACSATVPDSEPEGARSVATLLGLDLVQIETNEMSDAEFARNTPDRCYHCKRELFGRLTKMAEERGLSVVADGSNADDVFDHRPGSRAALEMGVVSPLRDVGMTKADIRAIARSLGLPNWDKPSMACLASRFPYGEPITADGVDRVAAAERALRALGLTSFRVRSHGDIARVEICAEEAELAWSLRAEVSAACHSAGFAYVAQDLDGYRTGSLNEVLRSE